jgi:LuxR family maltose regulon positive regulatory protein
LSGVGGAAGNEKPRAGARKRAARARAASEVAVPFEVVTAKVAVPSVRPGSVSRTALVNRLKAVNGRSVVTIAAPAGYGKTTLLSQWAVRDPRPFAWVSLDDRDNDPIVLLRHVAVALHDVEPLRIGVLTALKARAASIWTSIVPRLGAALSGFDPIVIVLDDVLPVELRIFLGFVQIEMRLVVADVVGW